MPRALAPLRFSPALRALLAALLAVLDAADCATLEEKERELTFRVVTGEASWYDFAAHIFVRASERGLHVPHLVPISTAEYPTPARRPANSRLDTAKITADFGINPRPWQDAIDDILAERLGREV